MPDYKEGTKKEVAEVKFLIHDLRVERFINEIVHFHVTLNTDLEIYGIDQAQVLHGEDLQALKTKAVGLRKAFQDYSNAVRSFSPDRTIFLAGKRYIDTIYSTCELILNPHWGRLDQVLSFLPMESRSAQARNHYLNCIHWIRGVHRRIENFRAEQMSKDFYQEFDIGTEIEQFTRDVIYGYVAEKSSGRVQIEFDRLDSAIVGGVLPRFRRMFFNLVMNSVDAMSNREIGIITISDTVQGDRVVLRVRDNGAGMAPEKVKELLTDKETLDGELHSLGFVFVRQTIEEFKGELALDSEPGRGTTITVSLPYLPDKKAAPRPASTDAEADALPRIDIVPHGFGGLDTSGEAAPAKPAAAPDDKDKSYGQMIYSDYEVSEAQFPGCIFAISVTEDDEIDFFTHKPYERYWNINHEDLSPMFFESTVRGRLEEDEEKKPILTFKAPQSVKEYFEFKNVPEKERGREKYIQMVHDEYVRIARKLIDTGLPPEIAVLLDGLQKFFPGRADLAKKEPFSLELLARETLAVS